MRRGGAARWGLALALAGGCGGAPAPTGPTASASLALAELLGQPLDAPAVVAFTAGQPATEAATGDARTWTIGGDDFACDLIALRGPVGGELAWRTFKLACTQTPRGELPRTYAGGLPAGLSWA